ncbi:hypothetical protein MPTK1_3g11320 [Marchantia polymorpha subsp. ruderalis]|uniref:CST complex subunit CTC1 n=2 Tax=Marchantia polymorpha TaxID=3197 RepID=A0A176VS96_MARPO|nr:hypothetical protein AXG93_1630s1170 [Marchantia polymorpha subsp. ruderalis]PTQ40886.1 hypothetical protein MARPO_0037s0065 [Marchantia polymorpha]BBN05219.1 hypothetical protein Mp_3g11320 [Marchantia polymorpha subsp. ruderalis]|eukprot:PTQ40886.1 hypothetical protein MARPO_0037s0065 [Marchantia polymorpha]
MLVVPVASLFKASTAFCSSSAPESHPDHGFNEQSLHVRSDIGDILGKRKEFEREFVRRAKKVKSEFQTLQNTRQCCSLVGRLQLCNKRSHSWGGSSVPGDCLAFTDSTASICCSITGGLDVTFVGRLIRVNSWSFIPLNGSRAPIKPNSRRFAARISPKTSNSSLSNPNDRSKSCIGKSEDRKSETVSGGAPEDGTDACCAPNNAIDVLGYLEIHRLQLMNEQDTKVITFPSLCVDPVTADMRNALFESPLIRKEEKRSRITICGKLLTISPQFSLPCNLTDDRGESKTITKVAGSSKDFMDNSKELSVTGFLVELQYCHSCSCQYIDAWNQGVKTKSRRSRQLFEGGHLSPRQGQGGNHEDRKFDRNTHLYFPGPLSAWRPILSGSLERCLTITGLRRKLVLTSVKKKDLCLFVATRTSLVSPVPGIHPCTGKAHCTLEKRDSELKKGAPAMQHADCAPDCELVSAKSSSMYPRVISYAGFVTSLLFQGTLVELDDRVWLIRSHQAVTQLHGLRVGAMLALRDVHATTIENSSEKALLLGACVRSHVSVLLFSPLHTPATDQLHSRNLLFKYMQKVTFASAFWILSVIGSFRKKFRGIYTDKELMGSKKDPGIILSYVQRCLAPDDSLERADYFMEFFDHQHMSCSGGTLASVSLSKVPPFSNFCLDIEASIRDIRSNKWLIRTDDCSDYQRWLEKERLLSSSEVFNKNWQSAHIISSQELGVTLLGSLQVCKKSGQLQLWDATGFVYVMVPDLLSSRHISKTYQVSSFTLIVKESTEDSSFSDSSRERNTYSSVSWSSLLKDTKATSMSSEASVFLIHFFLRDATLVDNLSRYEDFERFSQGCKRNSSGQAFMKDSWDLVGLELKYIITWLQQKTSELGSPERDVKFVCSSLDSSNSTNELFRVSCKVVAINFLVFESQCTVPYKNRQSSESCSFADLGVHEDWLFSLGIPLTMASVVIDDGYGLAHCWAHGDAAVTLLGLVKSSCKSELPPNLVTKLSEKFETADVQLSMEQYLCLLIRRHGKVVIRSERACGASVDTSYSLQWCGGNSPDCVEQAFMQAVVARACHNHPWVVTLGSIPPTVKDASESSRSPLDRCRTLAYRTGLHRSPVQDDEYPQLFALKVEPAVSLSDVRTVSDEIASLLDN